MRTQQAKQLSLPDLLSRLGYQPLLVSGDNLWYCSPLRSESKPSFCVRPGQQVAWIFSDYGANVKGNLLDFVMHYRHCDLKEALLWLEQIFGAHCLFAPIKQPCPQSTTSDIQPYSIKHIQHPALLSYLKKRAIKIVLANRYLREVHYHIGTRASFALGWQTDAGGWSLRAKDFKASVRPAGITTIGGNNHCLAIFEGMFDFLAALAYYQISAPRSQVIILNGVNHIHNALQKINSGDFRSIKLFLDNDPAGKKATQLLLALKNTRDCSSIFYPAKDFALFYETIVD